MSNKKPLLPRDLMMFFNSNREIQRFFHDLVVVLDEALGPDFLSAIALTGSEPNAEDIIQALVPALAAMMESKLKDLELEIKAAGVNLHNPHALDDLAMTSNDNFSGYLIEELKKRVTGPSSSTDNALARFDGVTGKLIQDSSLLLDDDGNLSKDNDDLLVTCGANKTLELQNIVYEDIQVSISNVRVPTSNAPTERLYNHGIGGGVTFPVLGFDTNEYIYFDIQTSHSMKLNTILDNHIHFMTPTDGTGDRFKFQLDVIVAGIGGSWTVPAGSPFTPEHLITADYTNKHKLFEIADIPASNTTVSSIYKCKLTRIAATADEYSGEIYMEFTDCHYQKNTMGSRQEGAK